MGFVEADDNLFQVLPQLLGSILITAVDTRRSMMRLSLHSHVVRFLPCILHSKWAAVWSLMEENSIYFVHTWVKTTVTKNGLC